MLVGLLLIFLSLHAAMLKAPKGKNVSWVSKTDYFFLKNYNIIIILTAIIIFMIIIVINIHLSKCSKYFGIFLMLLLLKLTDGIIFV